MIASLLLVAALNAAAGGPLAVADTLRPAASRGAGPVRVSPAWGPRGSPDSWTHEVGHVLAGVIAAPAVYGWMREAGASKTQARWVTAASILGAALAKELYDEHVVNSFSTRDIGITLAGGAVGLWLAERINWKETTRN